MSCPVPPSLLGLSGVDNCELYAKVIAVPISVELSVLRGSSVVGDCNPDKPSPDKPEVFSETPTCLFAECLVATAEEEGLVAAGGAAEARTDVEDVSR